MQDFIRIENLVFEYVKGEDNTSVRAIDDVSFVVEKGSFTAVIGQNGSGKSTLAKNINGLLTPTSGKVVVDGLDTSDHDNIWNIRQRVAMVFQNPDNQIVGTLVDEEVGFGPENIGVPTEEIWERVEKSLKAVGMYQFRSASPNKLSGGQKQRLSISLAIAKQPDVFIFDDSFSALDYKTDVALRKALKEHTTDSVVLIVAQRISTILHAEQIIVLDEGKVVGRGTHEELLKTCEVYQQIAMSQLSEEELAGKLGKEEKSHE